jgi:HD superfamily phosphohydrolase
MSGVSYGHYNIPALMDSITISSDGHMALKENRLDALMHFAVSRHAMYRQIYQHRVILAADCLLKAIVQRARDLEDRLEFADSIMKKVLTASDSSQLTLDEIFIMREAWWRYHLAYWQNSKDAILSDLAKRLFNRNLFKTIRVKNNEELNSFQQTCHNAVTQLGFDPKYYLFSISTKDINSAESSSSMKVILDDGTTQNINTADPLMSALVNGDHVAKKQWVVLPAEVKALLGRSR